VNRLDSRIFYSSFIILVAVASAILQPISGKPVFSALAGFGVALLATFFALRLRRAEPLALIAGSLGALAGSGFGLLAVFVVRGTPVMQGPEGQFFHLAPPLLGAYIGILVGVAKSAFLKVGFLAAPGEQPAASRAKVLDTSVLIDGRIADIAEAGFAEGQLIVPRFVLHELQLVADSADSARRNRGRRGLDVVQRLQKMPGIQLEISAQDFPGLREVDLKLIEFARLTGCKLVTNDFNLNKLAQVQGLTVLNINELANAVKPVVLPGETMRVFILKEGKEQNQGVAYLDDGTMVVVDNARRMISKTIDVTVTSVLQTTAGKMIFGRLDERPTGEMRAAAGGAN
jgi:predicted nucleic acid-binding protein